MRKIAGWLVVAAGVGVLLLDIFWVLMMLSAGLLMGFSGRSAFELLLLLSLGLVLPALATAFFASKAIVSARRYGPGKALRWLAVSLLPIPLLYLAWELGLPL